MNPKDLRKLDDKALFLRRQDLLGELTALKFQHAVAQLENTSALGAARRDIARVETVIREREIERGLNPGQLEAQVGKLAPEESAVAHFRRRMGKETAAPQQAGN
jgi:large subunit ribosomal protein L29